MLEKAVQETFDRECAKFEMAGIRSAVLEGDLRSFHAAAMLNRNQASVADGDAVNIGSQILEGGLPVAHRFAMHNPIFAPDLGRDLVKERRLLQSASKGGAEQLGKRPDRQEEMIARGQPDLSIWA